MAQLGVEGRQIVERHKGDAGQQRFEGRLGSGAAVHRKGAQRQTVKAVLDGDHPRPAGGGASQLESGFDGLGAAIDEQDPVGRRRRDLQEGLGEQSGQVGQTELREARGLQRQQILESPAHRRVVAPHVVHAKTAEPVEELRAVAVEQVRTLGSRPLPVEAEDPQNLNEAWVRVPRVQVEALAGTLGKQVSQAEVVHLAVALLFAGRDKDTRHDAPGVW